MEKQTVLPLIAKGAETVGGIVKLAGLLNVSHQTFYSWKKIPAERVVAFEKATGIPREELRPDLFGNNEVAA